MRPFTAQHGNQGRKHVDNGCAPGCQDYCQYGNQDPERVYTGWDHGCQRCQHGSSGSPCRRPFTTRPNQSSLPNPTDHMQHVAMAFSVLAQFLACHAATCCRLPCRLPGSFVHKHCTETDLDHLMQACKQAIAAMECMVGMACKDSPKIGEASFCGILLGSRQCFHAAWQPA